MEIVFIALIAILVIVIFLRKNSVSKVSQNKSINSDILHKKREYLTTENEKKLFFALRKALGEKYLIHCQVSLIALVDPVEYKFKSKAWSKRMDFVITDTATKVVCVIELDDATHKREKRVVRDCYVNSALNGHHTLIRLATQSFYKPEELAQLFEEKIGIQSIYNKNTHNKQSQADA